MKSYQKPLVELNQEIPSIQKDKEGKLRGGFCAMPLPISPPEGDETNENKNEAPGCTCSCVTTNSSCTNYCPNINCTTKSTESGGKGQEINSIANSIVF